jgi:predicted metal-dependent hydrolase
MKKRTGQEFFERLQALREFGLRRPCDACRVKVFRRWYAVAEGTVPQHRRLWRMVPERAYSGRIALRCYWHCSRYLESLKR